MFMFKLPYTVNGYRNVYMVIKQCFTSFPCISIEIILALNSDRNERIRFLASATNQVPAFFAAERVIGPVWPLGGRSRLFDVCILRASFCRFLVGFRHSRVLNYIRNCR